MADSADGLGLGVERASELVVLDPVHKGFNVPAVIEDAGLVLLGNGVNRHLRGAKRGGSGHRLGGLHRPGGQGEIFAAGELAGRARLHLGGSDIDLVADAAPLGIAGRSHNLMAAGAVALGKLGFMTADAARGGVPLFRLSNIGGMHSLVESDEVAFFLALDGVAVGAGLRITGVMAGFAFLNCFFVNKVVEKYRFHAGRRGICFSRDREHNTG